MEGRIHISSDGKLDACPVTRITPCCVDRQTFDSSIRNKKPIILTDGASGWFCSGGGLGLRSNSSVAAEGILGTILVTVDECEVDMLIPLDGRNFLKHSLCTTRSVDLKDGIRSILTRDAGIRDDTDSRADDISSDSDLTPILKQERRYIRVYFDAHKKILSEIDLTYLQSLTSDATKNDSVSSPTYTVSDQLNSPSTSSISSSLCDAPAAGGCVSPFKLRNIGLWISSEGCVTPLHFDICHGFLAQIVGRKTFLLASSSEFALLRYWKKKKTDGSQNGTTSSIDLGLWLDGDSEERREHPLVDEVAWFIAKLAPGDILYTPPGWWHYVISDTASASVLVPFDPSPHLETLPTNVLTA